MTTSLELAESPATDRWTPARRFLLVFAVVHIPLGVGGLLANHAFPIGAGATRAGEAGHLFGVFETNGWHSLGAVVLGLLAVAIVLNPSHARRVALAIGVLHVGLVVSLVLWDPSNFWIASNGADQVVHASSAVGGIAFGLLTRSPS